MEPITVPGPAYLYEHFYGPGIFRPLTRAFLAFAPPPPGGRVVDAACGTGLVTRHIAGVIGPQGSIVAFDINPKMLAIARDNTPDGARVEWLEADAHEVELPAGQFDMAYCQQGLQFFADPVEVLTRLRSSLRPGGRLALAVWQGIEHQALLAEFTGIEARHLDGLGVGYDDLIAPFSLGDAARLRDLLGEAGLKNIAITPHVVDADFDDPPTFARRMETAYGALVPAFVEDVTAFAAFLDAVERDARDVVDRYSVGDRVRFPMHTHFAIAEA